MTEREDNEEEELSQLRQEVKLTSSKLLDLTYNESNPSSLCRPVRRYFRAIQPTGKNPYFARLTRIGVGVFG